MSIARKLSCYSPFINHQFVTTRLLSSSLSVPTHVARPSQSHFQSLNNRIHASNDNNNLIVYEEHATQVLISAERGPPRWFCPLDFGSSRLPNSPLLLYLPGIGGSGLGLSLHHRRLGEMFDIWCLHIPATDRTPFPELVKLVSRTVQSENSQSPERPIYLVGHSFGACLALSTAACNPNIDILLVLANSATSYDGSQMRPVIQALEAMSKELDVALGYVLNLIPNFIGMASMWIAEITKAMVSLSSDLPGLTEILEVETLVWKLKLLDSACSYTNSRLHNVTAQTLILSSGRDQLLPSRKEGERLHRLLPRSDIRTFNDSGHMLFMDQDHDLVTILKATCFYRRTKKLDYVLDHLPPSPHDFEKAKAPFIFRFVEEAFSPVMLSTLDNGKVVRGLSGIPSEGPVLLVGYHMMMGIELGPLTFRIFSERGILVRGVAHPMMFNISKEGILSDISQYDTHRIMGAVPVSPTNLFKLFKLKSHILLYPGGLRESLHRKGEEYKLFWPEHSEFVRMAARFGAKIIPFGVVGEDDAGELVFDYEDQMKIPFLRRFIQELTDEAIQLRRNAEGDIANQHIHLPLMCPKLPGRFYYLFGKPIETQGRQKELMKAENAHELYLEVKSEVESCLRYLKEKREHDPYRSILSRFVYQLSHGHESEIPTFKLIVATKIYGVPLRLRDPDTFDKIAASLSLGRIVQHSSATTKDGNLSVGKVIMLIPSYLKIDHQVSVKWKKTSFIARIVEDYDDWMIPPFLDIPANIEVNSETSSGNPNAPLHDSVSHNGNQKDAFTSDTNIDDTIKHSHIPTANNYAFFENPIMFTQKTHGPQPSPPFSRPPPPSPHTIFVNQSKTTNTKITPYSSRKRQRQFSPTSPETSCMHDDPKSPSLTFSFKNQNQNLSVYTAPPNIPQIPTLSFRKNPSPIPFQSLVNDNSIDPPPPPPLQNPSTHLLDPNTPNTIAKEVEVTKVIGDCVGVDLDGFEDLVEEEILQNREQNPSQ
uniref:acyltransferase-like protein At3g26840, chloroplastic n=1 Tax=Erigeron canadensis TaxID=72917 RepID=UPI001CB9340D|nr:acyltransferase-like protein At3g26840, chloroplastic [Erigeron canadensis]